MFDPRRHRAGAPESPAHDAPVQWEPQRAAWVMALERAVHPALEDVFAANPRRRILDAFVHTVAQEGYEHTQLEQVLALAQVQEAVFQEHFEDMEDCMVAALDELVDGLRRIALERVAAHRLWSKRVHITLQTLLAALACHPDGARVTFVEHLSAGERPVAYMRSVAASLAPALDQGRGQGEDTGHLPAEASEAIVGGIASIIHRHVLEGRTIELPGLLEDLTYFALFPYLGHERALRASTNMDAGAL